MNKELLQGINVFLVGMMGSGKSTIGPLLAKQLNYHFLDTDSVIEQVTQKSISEIFATAGEAEFRELETTILGKVAVYTRTVVATGGGVVLQQKNWSYLQYGLVIWLNAPVNLLMQRLLEDQTRPLLQEENPELKLKLLLEHRQSLYRQADLQINLEMNQTPEQITLQIMEQIPSILK